jgi:hypothetical protein
MNNNIITQNNHKYVLYELYAVRGDIKHYFHFFFGVLLPLVLEYIEYKKKYEYVTFIVKDDVGPFFRVLFELPIDIKLKEFIHVDESLIEKKYLIPQNTHVMNQKSLKWIEKKYAASFTNSNRIIFNNWLKEQINKYNFFTYSPNNVDNYDIVINILKYLLEKNYYTKQDVKTKIEYIIRENDLSEYSYYKKHLDEYTKLFTL